MVSAAEIGTNNSLATPQGVSALLNKGVWGDFPGVCKALALRGSFFNGLSSLPGSMEPINWPGTMVHDCKPSTWEAEAGGS